MGFLQQIRDTLTPDDKNAREQIDILRKAANGQLERFRSDLVAKIRTPEAFKEEIVPNKMFQFFEEYRVSIKEGAANQIKGVVDKFFSGAEDSVKDGFSELIKLGFDAILGSTEAGESYTRSWYIMVEFGAIIRIDVMAWRYNFTGKGLIDKIENAFCYTVTKSFVDEQALSPMQLRYFLAKSMNLKSIEDIDKSDVLKRYLDVLMRYRKPPQLNTMSAIPAFERHYNITIPTA